VLLAQVAKRVAAEGARREAEAYANMGAVERMRQRKAGARTAAPRAARRAGRRLIRWGACRRA
jgi:hypothetical protein